MATGKRAPTIRSRKRAAAPDRPRRPRQPIASAALQAYNAKRDFDITLEPPGKTHRGKAGFAYVIQQHGATRMHFDFRLELDGVLLSWAVPKGPSLSVHEKRLAVQTEDHPLDYRHFEGEIPHGEYGGGPVIVWDRGTWQPDGDPHHGLDKGHLSFVIDGEKLHGRFQLLRVRGRRKAPERGLKSQWLLVKRDDEHARSGADAEPTQQMPRSVISGKTVQQIGNGTGDAACDKTGDAPMPSLDSIEPQLAQWVDGLPRAGRYRYEIKFDGYRLLAMIDGGRAQLRSRNGLDWTTHFPAVRDALAALPARDAIVDGELCYVRDDGHTDFQQLQHAFGLRGSKGRLPQHAIVDPHLVLYLFDLLYCDGVDWRDRPLDQRKQRLAALLSAQAARSVLRYSDDLQGDARSLLTQACRLGLEGLIGKRADAPYRSGRSRDWIKLKCQQRQEFVIVGYRPSKARPGFASLLLAQRRDGRLRYAGKVGTGFDEAQLRRLNTQLRGLERDAPPIDDAPRERGLVWVEPQRVCQVRYTEITRDGSLRHPSFEGLRVDKAAAEVEPEVAEPAPGSRQTRRHNAGRRSQSRTKASADASGQNTRIAGVSISHPDRVMDEASGLNKRQLAEYHERLGDAFLRYAAQRPLALVRCPQGDAQACFFQKHMTPGIGARVQSLDLDGLPALAVRDLAGVIELVQFNAMEFHGWGAPLPGAARPDWLIFDLDPDTTLAFSNVVDSALELRDILRDVGLPSFVKTTGGKGLHVVVPLQPRAGWAEVKAFSQHVAQTLADQQPQRYVATMSKAQRRGRIFIDYLRNGRGATAVLPYSPRARPGAPVALPMDWKQLRGLDPQEFRVDNAQQWLRRRRDPWATMRDQAVPLPLLHGSVR